MKISVGMKGELVLEQVYSNVVFQTKEGERLSVCMRDGAFMICPHRDDSTDAIWYNVDSKGVAKEHYTDSSDNSPN